MVHLNIPTVRLNIPTVRLNIPIVHLNIPIVRLNIPTVHLNIPIVHLNIPIVRLNIPILHLYEKLIFIINTLTIYFFKNSPKILPFSPFSTLNLSSIYRDSPFSIHFFQTSAICSFLLYIFSTHPRKTPP
jgi:hypothetical protein